MAGKNTWFFHNHAQNAVSNSNFCGAAMIETCHLMSSEEKGRKFSLAELDYRIMPFLKYVLWKHKVAKAANLWVKSHCIYSPLKVPSRWVRGAPNDSVGIIYHQSTILSR
jgi:hypothetical protein